MKYLALDVGNRWIGAAVGDTDVRIATPIDVIERRSLEQDVRVIEQMTRKFGVDQLVVGLPVNMNDTMGSQARAVQTFAERVSVAVGLPLTLWDERLTTVDATARLSWVNEANQKSRRTTRGIKSKRTIDAIAASLILQDFLNSMGGSQE